MPNWCGCDLIVTGDPVLLKKFRAKAKRIEPPEIDGTQKEMTLLSFEQFLPMPPELHNGGYCDWGREHWGTKWDASGVGLKRSKTGLHYQFDTAWSPPEPVVVEMSRQYPSLEFRFRFAEPGMCFYGEQVYCEGKRISDESFDEEQYRELYDEGYVSEKKACTELPYAKIKRKLLSNGFRLNYSHLLEKIIIARIPKEDLPLFVGYEWEFAEKEFAERLKEGA